MGDPHHSQEKKIKKLQQDREKKINKEYQKKKKAP